MRILSRAELGAQHVPATGYGIYSCCHGLQGNGIYSRSHGPIAWTDGHAVVLLVVGWLSLRHNDTLDIGGCGLWLVSQESGSTPKKGMETCVLAPGVLHVIVIGLHLVDCETCSEITRVFV